MRADHALKLSTRLAGGLLVAAMLVGAAMAADIPYQPRPKGNIATGYVDVRKDATHYVIAYSAADEAQAKIYLQRRAAEIGQSAGFTHFVFTDSGLRTLRVIERDLDDNFGIFENGADRNGFARNPTDYIPRSYEVGGGKFYEAWANVTFLTAEQARGQTDAVAVSQVLAAQGG